jgi:tetratricopeptide (TPR) repeat protein
MTHDLPSRWLVESYFDSFEHDIDHAIVLPSNISRTSDPATSPKSLEELFHKMIYLKRNKKYSEAKKCIDELLNMDLTSEVLVVVYNLHASFLYISGDVVAALETITEAVQHTFGKVNSLVKKAGFHCELGEIEEARICFNEAQLIDSNDSDVYLHWGQMDLINGNYDDAVRHLRKCISRSEALLVSHVSYAMALYKSGSIYQAMDVFENALLLFPQSTEAHLFFGEALADQGNYLDAMYHFYTAFRLSPDCPLPFLHAGRVYVSTNDPTRAISHFERALQIDPRCSSAHLDLAQVFFAQGRTEEALNHFDLAADNCRFLPEVEEVCSCKAMARMQLRVTEILGVELRHMMKVK